MDSEFFFKITIHVRHRNLSFPIRYFFSVALSSSRCIIASRPSLSPYSSLSMLFIDSAFHLCSFRSNILLQNPVVPPTFSTYLLREFSFVILKSLVWIVILHSVLVSFKSSFFCFHLLTYLFKLHCQVGLLYCFGVFIQTYPSFLFFLHSFASSLVDIISLPVFLLL